jgi:hypothetical protein
MLNVLMLMSAAEIIQLLTAEPIELQTPTTLRKRIWARVMGLLNIPKA